MPVQLTAQRDKGAMPAQSRSVSRMLLGLTGLFLIAAGGLLWWRHGAAVFSDYVLGALAWCF